MTKTAVVSVLLLFVLAGCGRKSASDLYKLAEESQQAVLHAIDSIGVSADRNALMEPVIVNYEKVFTEHPSSPEAEQALFKIGEIQSGFLNKPEKAVETFKRFVDAFPSSSRAPTALFMVGYIYNNNLAMIDSARAVYTRFLERYPQAELASSAQFELEHLGQKPDDLQLQDPPPDPARVAAATKK
jgi:outer membrane protein assembly factor BamD (BamD/ComL family)